MTRGEQMSRYCLLPTVVHTLVQEESVLLNLTTGVYHGLDQVGSMIWKLLEQGHTLDETVQSVVAAYELPADRFPEVRADLQRFIRQLEDRGLIMERDSR